MDILLTLGIFALFCALYYVWQTFFQTQKTIVSIIPPSNANRGLGNEDEDTSKPLCNILFASQTGTAEGFARSLAKDGKAYGFRTRCVDLLDYDPEDLPNETLVIFVVATYGEGEPTDSAKDFYEWFSDQDGSSADYSGVNFSVFGLGDTQYKHFNAIGELTDKHLEEMGAKRAFERGIGDADKSLEEDFEEWKANVWPQLAQDWNTTYDKNMEEVFTFEPGTKINLQDQPVAEWRPFTRMRVPSVVVDLFNPRVVYAKVTVNKELLNNSDRCTKHVEFSVKDTPLKGKYEAGDHLAIYAPNNPDLVADYLSAIDMGDITEDKIISLVGLKHGELKLPTKCTIKQALTWYFDLARTPKKEVLKTFSIYATDEEEKERFQSLLKNNPEAKAEYKKLLEKLRNTFGFFRKFKSVRVPLNVFLEVMPRQQPRYYSIASDSIEHPESIHVCAAYMEGGLCTTFLKNCQVGDEVPMYVRKSTFHLPACKEPVILIGPGTGVAPLIGFMWRRIGMQKQGKQLPECHFYFGCRHKAEDYLYQELLEQCEREGIVNNLFTAFSRDQEQKVYVQHLLEHNREDVFRMLGSQKGRLYICGDAKHMAKDVEAALVQIVQTCGGEQYQSAKAAESFISRLESTDRFFKDVWSVHS